MLRLRTFGGVWLESSDGSRVPSPRPQRTALLLIVAAAGRRGVSRNRLLAILWPDAEEDRARHALSQTLYALRRDLTHDPIRAEDQLRLDPQTLGCDAAEFREAMARRDWTAAAALYHGIFAQGFSFEEAPEFDRWLEQERIVFAREAKTVFEALAKDAAAAGDPQRAIELWHRLTDLDPVSTRFATSYMSALAAQGDRAGAIAHARHYALHLRHELDAEPDPVVVRLAEQLRRDARSAVAVRPDPVPQAIPAPSVAIPAAPVAESPSEARPSRRSWWVRATVALGVLVAAATVVLAVRPSRTTVRTPVLAVGQIRDLTAPDSARLGGVLSEVLATSVARLREIEVIANSRIIELMQQGTDTLRSARTNAARRAGATEIIEGELVPANEGQVRLTLRRVSMARGAVLGGYSVTGVDRLALLDSVASLIAADLRLSPPVRSLGELTARSPIALRLYEEGLRAYYQVDVFTAQTLFREALAEDSTFAMAASYGGRVSRSLGVRDTNLEDLALRLAPNAPDRERLLILTSISEIQNNPAAVYYADTLVTRFPRDPEALIRGASAMLFNAAITPRTRDLLERAIAIDSAAPPNPRAPCRLCESLGSLTSALRLADSSEAAERSLRRWIVLRPRDPAPLFELAMQQFYQGRYQAGVALVGKLADLPPASMTNVAPPIFLGRLLTGRYDEADAECTVRLREEDPRVSEVFRWLCPLLWRYQGRYRDAAGLVFTGRLPAGARSSGPCRRICSARRSSISK